MALGTLEEHLIDRLNRQVIWLALCRRDVRAERDTYSS